MADVEKQKAHLLNSGTPQAWFIRFLRSVRRKPHRRLKDHVHGHTLESRVSKKVVENIYKNHENTFSRIDAPLNLNVYVEKNNAFSTSPKPEDSLLRAFSKSKSYVHPDEADDMDEVPTKNRNNHGKSKSLSVFSSLGNFCSTTGEESFSKNSFSSEEVTSSRSRSGSRSPWFFLGCRSFSSRNREARHQSMEHLKTSELLQLDVSTELLQSDVSKELVRTEATKVEEIASKRHQKSEPWTGNDTRTWSMDLTMYGEVVKCLVDDVKLPPTNQISTTLGDLMFEPEADEAPMIHSHLKDEFEDPDQVPPWNSSISSFSSSREFWKSDEKTRHVAESNTALVPYNGEIGSVDIGNISDSQSLLRAKVFGAEMYRKQCQLEKKREEETKKLLLSLDQALDQYNHKRIIEEDDLKIESPNLELYNCPVFESFLESSTKALKTNSLPLQIEEESKDLKTPDSVRELHCITVQSPDIVGNRQELMLDVKGNMVAIPRVNVHQTNRDVDTGTSNRLSPSPSICEDRIHHPQGEDNTVLNFARLQIDELSCRKRQYNKPRRAHNERKLKQTAFGAESSASPPLPYSAGNVAKESVAVVVESSYDPYGDFRESMIDMIIDQNIRQTSDLEELLQCYLALNEPDYHQVIVEVFSDVWHEMFEGNSN